MNKESTISLRVEESMKNKLTVIAKTKDVSIAWIIRKAIEQYLQQEESNE